MAEHDASLSLCFWGVPLTVRAHPDDLAHLAFYFRDYLFDGGAPALVIHLECSAPGGFVAGIGEPRALKRVLIDTGAGPKLYEEFTDRARLPTPLPPLHCPPLSERLRVHHGAAFIGREGGAWCLRGESRAGKSTLLLALLARGARFMTDDLLARDTDGALLRYTRPVGVRERSARLFSGWAGHLQRHARPIETATGTTWMIHPADLGCALGPERAPVAGEIWLCQGADFELRPQAPDQLELTYDPQRHLERAVAALAERGIG